jgi:hypothetical protein
MCGACGTTMRADLNDTFTCRCGAMHLDFDAGRFGSNLGDDSILTFVKRPPGE